MSLTDIIGQLEELNKSNRMDKDNIRWSSLVNALAKLEEDPSDKKAIARACSRAGVTSSLAVLQSMSDIIDECVQHLQQAKKDLNQFKALAKEADKPMTESRRRKNESLDSDLLANLEEVFNDNFALPSYYGSDREFRLEIEAMADSTNDMMVDDAIMYLCDKFGYNARQLEHFRDELANELSILAQRVVDNIDQYASESKKCRLESRIKRLEKLMNDTI